MLTTLPIISPQFVTYLCKPSYVMRTHIWVGSHRAHISWQIPTTKRIGESNLYRSWTLCHRQYLILWWVFWWLMETFDVRSHTAIQHTKSPLAQIRCSDQCRQKKDHRCSLNIKKVFLRSNILRKRYTGMPQGGISAECTKFGGTKTRNRATR